MINWLAKQDEALLSLAFIYANNQYTFGVNVTEKWETAVQQHDALQKAYIKGQYDELRRAEARRLTGKWIPTQNPQWKAYYHDKCSVCGWWNTKNAVCRDSKKKARSLNYCPNCGAKMEGEEHD